MFVYYYFIFLQHAEKQNAEKQMELEAMTITADKSAPRENSVFDEVC